MTWKTLYQPPQHSSWQGRADSPEGACFFQVIQLLNLLENPAISPSSKRLFGLIGFCCDEGVRRNLGRVGAAEGPSAIRSALAKLAVHAKDFICYDMGDITCPNQELESSQYALGDVIAQLLEKNITPIVLGGGHELAWGHYQGIKKAAENTHLSIINFDAHLDMRALSAHHQGSSGTPFLQIAQAQTEAGLPFNYYCVGMQAASNTQALLETAKQYQVVIASANELQNPTSYTFLDHLMAHSPIYVSLCLDVFSSAFAPGVSAPQAMGLTPWQLKPLLQKLAASGKVISYDIAELCPRYDIDERTAKLAALFVHDIIHHHVHLKD